MFAFLENRYELTKSDELGTLLGSMALLKDKTPIDDAIWEDWQRALSRARSGKVRLEFGSS